MAINKTFRNAHVYGKATNLTKVAKKFGATAINVFIVHGRLDRFETFISLACAWKHHKEDGAECYTLTLENAVKTFPQYFTM